jgi:hypothetical protein
MLKKSDSMSSDPYRLLNSSFSFSSQNGDLEDNRTRKRNQQQANFLLGCDEEVSLDEGSEPNLGRIKQSRAR